MKYKLLRSGLYCAEKKLTQLSCKSVHLGFFALLVVLLITLTPGMASGVTYECIPNTDPVLYDLEAADLPNNAADNAFLQQVDIFILPNPNAGKFSLEISGEIPEGAELRIINVEGKKVYSRPVNQPGILYLNLTSLRKGIYFAQLRVNEKMISHPIIYSFDSVSENLTVPQTN